MPRYTAAVNSTTAEAETAAYTALVAVGRCSAVVLYDLVPAKGGGERRGSAAFCGVAPASPEVAPASPITASPGRRHKILSTECGCDVTKCRIAYTRVDARWRTTAHPLHTRFHIHPKA